MCFKISFMFGTSIVCNFIFMLQYFQIRSRDKIYTFGSGISGNKNDEIRFRFIYRGSVFYSY